MTAPYLWTICGGGFAVVLVTMYCVGVGLSVGTYRWIFHRSMAKSDHSGNKQHLLLGTCCSFVKKKEVNLPLGKSCRAIFGTQVLVSQTPPPPSSLLIHPLTP